MPSIKIEHKNFSFLEFYGGCGGLAVKMGLPSFFRPRRGVPPRKISFSLLFRRETHEARPHVVRGPSKHVPTAIVDLDTDEGAAAGCKNWHPPPLLVPARAGEGSRISASGPILDPPKFTFCRFSKFQIFIVCVNATHGFHRQPRSKKTWQISMFFHVHANRTHVPSKIRRKTVLKVMKNMQSSTWTARAVGARAHNGNMGSEGIKFR